MEQDEAVGHAVRATYMYSGMADVAALTGDEAYVKALDRIWDNVVGKKLYLTGGIVAVENVFAFPGIGAALTAAVANRDIPVVQAIAMLLAAVALIVYLVADVLHLLLSPRLRTAGQ